MNKVCFALGTSQPDRTGHSPTTAESESVLILWEISSDSYISQPVQQAGEYELTLFMIGPSQQQA